MSAFLLNTYQVKSRRTFLLVFLLISDQVNLAIFSYFTFLLIIRQVTTGRTFLLTYFLLILFKQVNFSGISYLHTKTLTGATPSCFSSFIRQVNSGETQVELRYVIFHLSFPFSPSLQDVFAALHLSTCTLAFLLYLRVFPASRGVLYATFSRTQYPPLVED